VTMAPNDDKVVIIDEPAPTREARKHEQVLTYMILIGVRSAVAPDFNGGPVPVRTQMLTAPVNPRTARSRPIP
jgi:hypothetical protein